MGPGAHDQVRPARPEIDGLAQSPFAVLAQRLLFYAASRWCPSPSSRCCFTSAGIAETIGGPETIEDARFPAFRIQKLRTSGRAYFVYVASIAPFYIAAVANLDCGGCGRCRVLVDARWKPIVRDFGAARSPP